MCCDFVNILFELKKNVYSPTAAGSNSKTKYGLKMRCLWDENPGIQRADSYIPWLHRVICGAWVCVDFGVPWYSSREYQGMTIYSVGRRCCWFPLFLCFYWLLADFSISNKYILNSPQLLNSSMFPWCSASFYLIYPLLGA